MLRFVLIKLRYCMAIWRLRITFIVTYGALQVLYCIVLYCIVRVSGSFVRAMNLGYLCSIIHSAVLRVSYSFIVTMIVIKPVIIIIITIRILAYQAQTNAVLPVAMKSKAFIAAACVSAVSIVAEMNTTTVIIRTLVLICRAKHWYWLHFVGRTSCDQSASTLSTNRRARGLLSFPAPVCCNTTI